MNQDLIVFVIIASTIGYTIYSFIRGIKVEKKQSGCGGCSGCELSKNK
ncbi:FeoB-associated Cys-rich membrane protein [bacterium]|nr:FeoB-associated Cys-rich membrane protein [bacterium]